jgi:hypothetical protein
LLRACDVILCLTKDNHTFQSDANEALWMGKPLITSDWPILKEYFNKGTIHTDNSIESIHKALLQMQNNLAALKAEMVLLQEERKAQWYEKAEKLVRMIDHAKSS